MKTARNIVICVAAILLSVPLAYTQDLSRYRNFSLGTSLIQVSRQVNEKPAEASVIHQRPALIQELTWWPMPSYQSSTPVDPVQQILFSFYNGALYKMVVTYDGSTTEGLTAEDMTRASRRDTVLQPYRSRRRLLLWPVQPMATRKRRSLNGKTCNTP